MGNVKLVIWVNPIAEVLKIRCHSHIFKEHLCII